tara:strand:+ start:57 stop:632 length:576 start_codon:yes stop_codon:yes gene_type:complete
MKRLLLPLISAFALPIGVHAFPFSKDILIKSDLNEQYVVKDSAVYPSEFNKYLFLAKINYFEKSWKDMLPKDCSGPYSFLCDKVNESIKQNKEHKQLFDEVILPGPKIYEIKFRTINTDLNGKKKAGNYQKVICISPKLEQSIRTKIIDLFASYDVGDAIDLQNKSGSNVFDDFSVGSSLNQKVCEKYAKY